MKPLTPFTLAGSLALLLSCGGGSGEATPIPAQHLVYQDPSTSGWQFKRNPASTDSHLILDLLPPASETQGRGVVLQLTLNGTGASWAPVSADSPNLVRNGGVYRLGSGVQALAGVVSASDLKLVVAQKGRGNPATYAGAPVLSVALDLNPGAATGPASNLTITVAKAFHLPATGPKVDLANQIQIGSLRLER